MEAILEVLVMALLAMPGILIRWIIHRGRIPFKVLSSDDIWYNASYTVFVIIVIIVLNQFVFDK